MEERPCNILLLSDSSHLIEPKPTQTGYTLRPISYTEPAADVAIEQWQYRGEKAKEYQKDMFDRGLIYGVFHGNNIVGGVSGRRYSNHANCFLFTNMHNSIIVNMYLYIIIDYSSVFTHGTFLAMEA